MTTYFVKATGSNTNGLTTATAFTTISAAAAVAISGDTINVLAGNYAGGIFLGIGGTYNNGSSAMPITLQSSPRLAAKIIASGAPPVGGGNDAMIEIRANGWIIDGFEITALAGYSGGAGTWAWTLGGAGQFRVGACLTGIESRVRNCYIHHIGLADPGGAGGSGVLSEGFYNSYIASRNYIQYNHIHDIGSSLTLNSVHGIYITNADTHVQGNLVYCSVNNWDGCLIHGWHGYTGGSISNNTVFNSTNVGILVGQGDGGAGIGAANCRVFNNIIVQCNVGIDEQGAITVPRNLYSNNLIFNTATQYAINVTSTAVNRLTGDPGFVNYIRTGGGDYHLATGSPMIDAGIPSLSGVDATTLDIDGTTRPLGGVWDVGAYEYIPAGGDTTPPVLTSPTGIPTGPNTATIGITTDTGEGRLWGMVSTNPTEAEATIIATAEANNTFYNLVATGVKTFNVTGLNASTTYYAHFLQDDAAANRSSVVNSASFVTDAIEVGVPIFATSGRIRRFLDRR